MRVVMFRKLSNGIILRYPLNVNMLWGPGACSSGKMVKFRSSEIAGNA